MMLRTERFGRYWGVRARPKVPKGGGGVDGEQQEGQTAVQTVGAARACARGTCGAAGCPILQRKACCPWHVRCTWQELALRGIPREAVVAPETVLSSLHYLTLQPPDWGGVSAVAHGVRAVQIPPPPLRPRLRSAAVGGRCGWWFTADGRSSTEALLPLRRDGAQRHFLCFSASGRSRSARPAKRSRQACGGPTSVCSVVMGHMPRWTCKPVE